MPIGNPRVRAGLRKWAAGQKLTPEEAANVLDAARASEPAAVRALECMAGQAG